MNKQFHLTHSLLKYQNILKRRDSRLENGRVSWHQIEETLLNVLKSKHTETLNDIKGQSCLNELKEHKMKESPVSHGNYT